MRPINSWVLVLLAAAALSGCRRFEILPFRCDDVQTVTEVDVDVDPGLGFTAVELAESLRAGRALQVEYETTRPPSGDERATYVITPFGPPGEAAFIDRTDIGAAPPGICMTGKLLRFTMDAKVSFTLGGVPVELPATRATIEANGTSDHRVDFSAIWSVPTSELNAEVLRQASEAVADRHGIAHVDLGLGGRLNPDQRLDYRGWIPTLVILNAIAEPAEEGADPETTNLILGAWFSAAGPADPEP